MQIINPATGEMIREIHGRQSRNTQRKISIIEKSADRMVSAGDINKG